MANIVKRRLVERRRRGVFGWLFLGLFWAWNALMAYGTISGMAEVAQQGAGLATEAERTGHAIGTGIGLTMMLVIWGLGAVILGAMAYFTRGKSEMVEIESR